MSFVHEDRDAFVDLIEIVAAERGLRRSLVEKDYWVTHALWALSEGGFDVWFKGGTSLSKGFGLIERFSEDLDLKVEPGAVTALPSVENWRSEGPRATGARRAYFEALARTLVVPSCRVELAAGSMDASWRGAGLHVTYPGMYSGELPKEVSEHVLLEVGSARVTPYVPRDITSWVHEKLAATGHAQEFRDNRAQRVRCIHPLVTLLEKLDALHRRFPNARAPAQTFVRHYEDAARIVARIDGLPPLDDYPDVGTLAREMVAERQLAAMPSAGDPALAPTREPRWDELRAAHAAIDPMFWGPRITLDEACASIRAWVDKALG